MLDYLIQNLLKESRTDPDVFDGLGRERLRGAAGGGGALSSHRFMANALGSPVGHRAKQVTTSLETGWTSHPSTTSTPALTLGKTRKIERIIPFLPLPPCSSGN